MKKICNANETIKTINILLIDDFRLRHELESELKSSGFTVCEVVTNPTRAISAVMQHSPDIVAIHLDLNFKGGRNLGEEIWHKFKLPIIYLVTKHNDKKIKQTLSSEPFGFFYLGMPKEGFKANIENVYRNFAFFKTFIKGVKPPKKEFLQLAQEFWLDTHRLELYEKEKKIALTKLEKKLFEITSRYKADVAPLNTIYSYIYRDELFEYGKLRTLIYRLRKKLGFDLFQSYPSKGYKLKVA